MPPKTAGKTPVIVYLDDADHALLVALATQQDRTLSATARQILKAELKPRPWTPGPAPAATT